MSLFVKLIMLFLVANAKQLANANSRGAPEEACLNMEPQHGPLPQTTAAPFSVTPQQIKPASSRAERSRFLSRPKVLEDLSKVNDSPSGALGRFINSPRQARSIDRRPGQSNALTHRDGKGKDKLEFTWVAPPDFQGEIEFRSEKFKHP